MPRPPLGFGLTYAVAHAALDAPKLAPELAIPDTVHRALTERVRGSGSTVVEAPDAATSTIEVTLTELLLDFSLGTWTANMTYAATFRAKEKVFCRQDVAKEASRFNMWGYASGEAALSEVFNAAINGLDLVDCKST